MKKGRKGGKGVEIEDKCGYERMPEVKEVGIKVRKSIKKEWQVEGRKEVRWKVGMKGSKGGEIAGEKERQVN